ncbi:MAG: hypothetical protein HC933_03975 [Pleurocapsa sp. SU_196_0]|nr:hypothetical protein [Pleurocapsa sp. SU_196_0]
MSATGDARLEGLGGVWGIGWGVAAVMVVSWSERDRRGVLGAVTRGGGSRGGGVGGRLASLVLEVLVLEHAEEILFVAVLEKVVVVLDFLECSLEFSGFDGG